MPLNPPTPGLRRIGYDARSFGKVSLSVPPGDELHVSDVVAGQLLAASAQFKDLGPNDPPPVDGRPAEVALITYETGDELPVDPETFAVADDDTKVDAKPKRTRKS